MVEYLENLRKELLMSEKTDLLERKYNSIKRIRKLFINARNSLLKFDKSLNLIHFVDSINTISTIMLHIYMIAIGIKDPIINSMSPSLVFITIMCSSKLITSCIIHGKVYEQTEKLLLTFDEL